jgi:hypothetical protein
MIKAPFDCLSGYRLLKKWLFSVELLIVKERCGRDNFSFASYHVFARHKMSIKFKAKGVDMQWAIKCQFCCRYNSGYRVWSIKLLCGNIRHFICNCSYCVDYILFLESLSTYIAGYTHIKLCCFRFLVNGVKFIKHDNHIPKRKYFSTAVFTTSTLHKTTMFYVLTVKLIQISN